ncbi:MAG: ferritin family protein [Candidatus Cloacimonetes bacterium]|nr:ferritin family protein [Candidatus Cloacimonadota bacterium]MBL7086617.1 ferritin family protein [Candidatus Cloacimonadota bacterium]
MSNIFNASEIYQFAIRIEENGEKFYRQMAKKLDEPKVKELFALLADDEVVHKKTFKEMLSQIETYEPPESYPGEYFEYLRAYVDNVLFSINKFDEDVEKIHNALEAIQFAIDKELDSVLYYQEMRNVVLAHQKELIKNIIEEERRHVVKLSEIKRKMK